MPFVIMDIRKHVELLGCPIYCLSQEMVVTLCLSRFDFYLSWCKSITDLESRRLLIIRTTTSTLEVVHMIL